MQFENQDWDEWDELIELIESGHVLPIIGQGVTTMTPENKLLQPWLTKELATALKIEPTELPDNPELHDVVCRLVMNEGKPKKAYRKINGILSGNGKPSPLPGETLRQLASINGFRFFLTTTFDSLLETAINDVRYGGHNATRICKYSPKLEDTKTCDLPARHSELPGTTVFHLLGQASNVREYVIWEDDMLDFIIGLHKNLPNMKNLSYDLEDTNLHYLVLGLSFSDWLVRFFLRVMRQKGFVDSITRDDYLADKPGDVLPDNLVMFFNKVVKNVNVLPCDPCKFVAELAKRWKEKHGEEFVARTTTLSPSDKMPKGSVFISYAREDSVAARRIANELATFGCDVWYDIDRLQTGMNYENVLRDEVKRYCSVFISVVSKHTEQENEAYFHKERNWAAERAESMADQGARFYNPVIIEEGVSKGGISKKPNIFSQSQVTKLIDGAVTNEFADRILEIQRDARREI